MTSHPIVNAAAAQLHSGDLAALIHGIRSPLIHAEQVTSLASNRDTRGSWRLQFADGRILKMRQFESSQRAADVQAIRELLPQSLFVRVLARVGAAMIEEWVEGEVLNEESVTLEQVRASGRMLGQLHTCQSPADSHTSTGTSDVSGWLQQIHEHLAMLVEARVLTTNRAMAIESCAASRQPVSHRISVVHRDLCPENIVVDRGGMLHWIDAGTLTIGSIEEDLCRMWYRWPMNANQREAFIEGYETHGDAGMLRRPSVFWLIAVLVGAARYRLVGGGSDLAALVERLDQVVKRSESGTIIDDLAEGGECDQRH